MRAVRIACAGMLLFVLSALLSGPTKATPGILPSRGELARARPGQVLRLWPLEGGAPSMARGYRVLYRSIGAAGQPIAVSGAIFIPSKTSEQDRLVVAWAHPTTGIRSQCAPTARPGMADNMPGLAELLERGYIVVATDYALSGAADVQPYLIGSSEGRAVLDSVRAAASLREARASRRFVVWGYSQGGHAALFAGAMARKYAPELDLVGIAAVAPPTDLAAVLDADQGTQRGNVLTTMTVKAWSQTYRLPLRSVVRKQALERVAKIANDCLLSAPDLLAVLSDSRGFDGRILIEANVRRPPWATLIRQNSPVPAKFEFPLLLVQGTGDDILPASITRKFADGVCRARGAIDYVEISGATHNSIMPASIDTVISWLDTRQRGENSRGASCDPRRE